VALLDTLYQLEEATFIKRWGCRTVAF